MVGKRKLGRATSSRKAMLRAMVTFFLENGEMKTTISRAKEVRSMAERIITMGKDNSLASKRRVMQFITKEGVTRKLFDEIAPKYLERNGGYVTIARLGNRRGDAAQMALLRLV